uniref:Uncharacterized protein n=1 Tax=Physcomitrium patens TaxID=3218 RepID=A0A2K1JHT3_PHYPA|nr:hypothetical protein PHYPA_018515 [Physcomitrium patens]
MGIGLAIRLFVISVMFIILSMSMHFSYNYIKSCILQTRSNVAFSIVRNTIAATGNSSHQ